MKIDFREIRAKTAPVGEYIQSLDPPFREKYLARKQEYQPKPEALQELRQVASSHVIVVFSAQWCKDCAVNVPVLALISEQTGIEVRVFGGLKKDPLSHVRKWRVPPSPPEVETFNVDKIPLIIVFDSQGNEVGRMVENPVHMPTLEEELLEIIKSRSAHFRL